MEKMASKKAVNAVPVRKPLIFSSSLILLLTSPTGLDENNLKVTLTSDG